MAKIEDAESLFEVKIRYTPAMTADERTRLQNEWHRAVERVKNWIE
jgi:glycerol kinase